MNIASSQGAVSYCTPLSELSVPTADNDDDDDNDACP